MGFPKGELFSRAEEFLFEMTTFLPYAVVGDDKNKALGCQVE